MYETIMINLYQQEYNVQTCNFDSIDIKGGFKTARAEFLYALEATLVPAQGTSLYSQDGNCSLYGDH